LLLSLEAGMEAAFAGAGAAVAGWAALAAGLAAEAPVGLPPAWPPKLWAQAGAASTPATQQDKTVCAIRRIMNDTAIPPLQLTARQNGRWSGFSSATFPFGKLNATSGHTLPLTPVSFKTASQKFAVQPPPCISLNPPPPPCNLRA